MPEVGLGNSVAWGAVMEGDLTGRQCMSQSRNMAAHQWLPGGLLYSGTASLLKHVANICYAKATFMLNVTGWVVAGGEGGATHLCIHHAYWPNLMWTQHGKNYNMIPTPP